MRDDERVFLMGEDVGHFGGPFGVSKGLLEEFGDERVIDTPIAEEGFVGAAFGAAWMGERPIAELQFADFISCAVRLDRHRGREDALAQRHQAAGRDPLAVRRRRARRAVPRAAAPRASSSASPGSRWSARARVEDAYGLLRSADRGRRPGALLRAQGALPPAARRGAGGVDCALRSAGRRDRAQRLRRRRS